MNDTRELTDEQCDEFRRTHGSFNTMVRTIYAAGRASMAKVPEETLTAMCDAFEAADCPADRGRFNLEQKMKAAIGVMLSTLPKDSRTDLAQRAVEAIGIHDDATLNQSAAALAGDGKSEGTIPKDDTQAEPEDMPSIGKIVAKTVRKIFTDRLNLTYDQRSYSWHEVQDALSECDKMLRAINRFAVRQQCANPVGPTSQADIGVDGQEPDGYFYEWDTQIGLYRSLNGNDTYNGCKPDRTIGYYLSPQPTPSIPAAQEDTGIVTTKGHASGLKAQEGK